MSNVPTQVSVLRHVAIIIYLVRVCAVLTVHSLSAQSQIVQCSHILFLFKSSVKFILLFIFLYFIFYFILYLYVLCPFSVRRRPHNCTAPAVRQIYEFEIEFEFKRMFLTRATGNSRLESEKFPPFNEKFPKIPVV